MTQSIKANRCHDGDYDRFKNCRWGVRYTYDEPVDTVNFVSCIDPSPNVDHCGECEAVVDTSDIRCPECGITLGW